MNLLPSRISARQLAAIPINPAFRTWLFPFRCDAAIHAAITQAAREIGAALSFEGERPIVWQTVNDPVYGVLARADGDTYYAIPTEADLPAHFRND